MKIEFTKNRIYISHGATESRNDIDIEELIDYLTNYFEKKGYKICEPGISKFLPLNETTREVLGESYMISFKKE